MAQLRMKYEACLRFGAASLSNTHTPYSWYLPVRTKVKQNVLISWNFLSSLLTTLPHVHWKLTSLRFAQSAFPSTKSMAFLIHQNHYSDDGSVKINLWIERGNMNRERKNRIKKYNQICLGDCLSQLTSCQCRNDEPASVSRLNSVTQRCQLSNTLHLTLFRWNIFFFLNHLLNHIYFIL